MGATDETTKVGRPFSTVVGLQAFPFQLTHIIREGLDTPCQRGDLHGQSGHLFFEALLAYSERGNFARQDSDLFWQGQKLVGEYQTAQLRTPLRMRFYKAYKITELIGCKRHVFPLLCAS